ncbi:MAG: hypothetical protein U1E00_04120 [Pseudoxanthomonas sp.]|nr:hypothetical protein [Pseudoxanthomonas sp.]
MNFKRTAFVLALAATLAAPAALASDAAAREQLSRQLLDRWSSHVEEAYQQPGGQWSSDMAPLLKTVALDDLRKAAAADNFDVMNDHLMGKAGGAGEGGSTQALGDAATDLVFVPITPCRLLDTRLAGGAIAANTVRHFDVTAVSDYSFQGGAANNCNAGNAGSFAAAVINFTVVTPAGAGYITAFPYLGTQPLAATVNYTAGDIRGNLATVQLDQGASASEMSVYSFAQTHLVADIVGYFKNPPRAPLDCVETAYTTVAVAAGATANANAPACGVGYSMTTTNCQASSWDMPFVFQANGTCSAKNNGGASADLRAGRTCCRAF